MSNIIITSHILRYENLPANFQIIDEYENNFVIKKSGNTRKVINKELLQSFFEQGFLEIDKNK